MKGNIKVKWLHTKNKRELKKLYLSILPTIREVARKSGYAIGVHGSLTRDFDIIAAPWTDKAVAPELLARRIELAVCEYPLAQKYHLEAVRKNVGKKPHGRLAVTIYLGTYAYIDLSIMPRLPK